MNKKDFDLSLREKFSKFFSKLMLSLELENFFKEEKILKILERKRKIDMRHTERLNGDLQMIYDQQELWPG